MLRDFNYSDWKSNVDRSILQDRSLGEDGLCLNSLQFYQKLFDLCVEKNDRGERCVVNDMDGNGISLLGKVLFLYLTEASLGEDNNEKSFFDLVNDLLFFSADVSVIPVELLMDILHKNKETAHFIEDVMIELVSEVVPGEEKKLASLFPVVIARHYVKLATVMLNIEHCTAEDLYKADGDAVPPIVEIMKNYGTFKNFILRCIHVNYINTLSLDTMVTDKFRVLDYLSPVLKEEIYKCLLDKHASDKAVEDEVETVAMEETVSAMIADMTVTPNARLSDLRDTSQPVDLWSGHGLTIDDLKASGTDVSCLVRNLLTDFSASAAEPDVLSDSARLQLFVSKRDYTPKKSAIISRFTAYPVENRDACDVGIVDRTTSPIITPSSYGGKTT